MRKLKLQMQSTVDGYVAGPEGQLDWMDPGQVGAGADPEIHAFINEVVDTSDTILMGRKMTPDFVNYWEKVAAQPDSPEHAFAQKMVALPKVVFSRTVKHVDGRNVRVENGDLAAVVTKMKGEPGKDLLVYGGATFVASLIEHGLIDEMHLFVNPVAIGNGMRIFKERKPLELTASRRYARGMVVNSYQPSR